MQVTIQVPTNRRTIEGVLIKSDMQTNRLKVRVAQGADVFLPNTLAQATLLVGGVPRKFTVFVSPIDPETVSLTPVANAQVEERRKTKRYPVSMPVEIMVDGSVMFARALNMSVSGMGVQSPYPLDKGKEFTAMLPLLGREMELQVRGRVRNLRAQPNGSWYIGAEFIGLNHTDQLWLRQLFP
ncbi:MAG: PilZ domain-containing protein [bacterium]|nr:PilZ domain-containing protein [bacterium]